MTKTTFLCPSCAFSQSIPEDEIPETATQCRCPGCKKTVSLAEAIVRPEFPPDSDSIDQVIDDCFEHIQAQPTKKIEFETASLDRYYELLEEGITLVDKKNAFEALHLLEEAERLNSSPKARSYLAYCRAKVKHEYADSIRVCRQALKDDPRNAAHYLNLGRIYLMVNKRGPALKVFRKGIKLGPHQQLMKALRSFELRRPSVFPSLDREHFLNRSLGKMLSRLRLR